MRTSSITVEEISFLALSVEIDPKYDGRARDYEFDGTLVRSDVQHGVKGESDTTSWWVGVEFETRSTEDKRCPYEIRFKAVGIFHIDESIQEEKREKLVFESGAALVYGAIREMVSTLTARSVFGAMMLPTVSFFGEFENYKRRAEETEKQAKDRLPD